MNPPYESTENKNEDPNNEPSNNLMMMSTMPAQTNQVEINLYEEKSSEKKRHERQRLLHLYCDCFLNGNYCGNFCTCETCKNKIETHNEVEGALKKFKARNPHAFDSKMENGCFQGCNCANCENTFGKKSSPTMEGDSTPTPTPTPTPTTSSGSLIYEMENGLIGVNYPDGAAPGPTTYNSILSNQNLKDKNSN
ncbi:hypothetical protein F8388_027016 [Cannabis sativa]|uniref:CRC domain-containing protein n=1 Tax=Cannabis sativa TaxID=3483 RepID=A0A7J6FNP4_CANSA|nr:hypothetical protein F8388_027016 [Cannabis sativa]